MSPEFTSILSGSSVPERYIQCMPLTATVCLSGLNATEEKRLVILLYERLFQAFLGNIPQLYWSTLKTVTTHKRFSVGTESDIGNSTLIVKGGFVLLSTDIPEPYVTV